MLSPSDAIRAKIEEKEATLARLDRERQDVERELATWREALRLILKPMSDDNAEEVDDDDRDGRRGRGLSSQWKATLLRLWMRPQFGYEEVQKDAKREGLDLELNSLRSRINGYLNKGYVERIEDGLFRVTPKGKEAAE